MNTEAYKMKNVEIVEIPVDQSRRKYFLPAQTSFNGRKITGIEVIARDSSEMPEHYTGTGRIPVNKETLKNIYLTLHVAGKEKVKQYPVRLIYPPYRNGHIMGFGDVIVNDKSFIEVTELDGLLPIMSASPNYQFPGWSVLLVFYFED